MRGIVVLVLVTACAGAAPRSAAPSTEVAPSACGDVSWGGYADEPHCAELAGRRIAGADRGCVTDADCALVHAGASCREIAVSASAASRYAPLEASCTHPAGGPCSPASVVCASGCCLTRR